MLLKVPSDCDAQDLQIDLPNRNLSGPHCLVSQSSISGTIKYLNHRYCRTQPVYAWIFYCLALGCKCGGYFAFNKYSHAKMISASWNGLFHMKEKSCRAKNALLLWELTKCGFLQVIIFWHSYSHCTPCRNTSLAKAHAFHCVNQSLFCLLYPLL